MEKILKEHHEKQLKTRELLLGHPEKIKRKITEAQNIAGAIKKKVVSASVCLNF